MTQAERIDKAVGDFGTARHDNVSAEAHAVIYG